MVLDREFGGGLWGETFSVSAYAGARKIPQIFFHVSE
jgi:hypothetical protein